MEIFHLNFNWNDLSSILQSFLNLLNPLFTLNRLDARIALGYNNKWHSDSFLGITPVRIDSHFGSFQRRSNTLR